jgi:hypothetical protein
LPKEWGARETREKTRKGMRGVGWEAHVTSRDPTLNAGRAPARSGVACPKNLQRQYLTCPSEFATTSLCLRNGARQTREKTRKGMRGVGWEAHVTSRDPTLNSVGTRSCAIRRGMATNRATAIFDLSLRVCHCPGGVRDSRQAHFNLHRALASGCEGVAAPDRGALVAVRWPRRQPSRSRRD